MSRNLCRKKSRAYMCLTVQYSRSGLASDWSTCGCSTWSHRTLADDARPISYGENPLVMGWEFRCHCTDATQTFGLASNEVSNVSQTYRWQLYGGLTFIGFIYQKPGVKTDWMKIHVAIFFTVKFWISYNSEVLDQAKSWILRTIAQCELPIFWNKQVKQLKQ